MTEALLLNDRSNPVLSIRSQGGHRITKTHVATNHVWSDRRIELAADVITWLKRLP